MFYVLRFNMALALLGFDLSHFAAHQRRAAQKMGKRSRITPEEAVLFLVAQLPHRDLSVLKRDIVIAWTRQDKLRLHRLDVAESLVALNLSHRALMFRL